MQNAARDDEEALRNAAVHIVVLALNKIADIFSFHTPTPFSPSRVSVSRCPFPFLQSPRNLLPIKVSAVQVHSAPTKSLARMREKVSQPRQALQEQPFENLIHREAQTAIRSDIIIHRLR